MVQKLSISLALEGGKEIEKQLADIGEAGKKAFADIVTAAEKTGGFKSLNPDEVKDKLKALGVTGVDAITKIQDAVRTAGRLETMVQGVAAVESGFQKLAAAAGPVVETLVAGFILATNQALAWANAINKLSNEAMRLGLSAQEVDKLKRSFETAGISAEAISDGLKHVKGELDKLELGRITTAFQQLQEASKRGFGGVGTSQFNLLIKTAQGVGPAADAAREALAKLGATNVPLDPVTQKLNQLGVAGQTLPERLALIVAELEKMPDTAQRTDTAFKLLGDKLGPEFVAAMQTGSAALINFKTTLGGVTQEQAIEAAKTQQTLNLLTTEWNNFKSDIVAPVAIPLLGFLRDGLTALKDTFASGLSDPFASTIRDLEKIGEAVVNASHAVGDFVASIAQITWNTIADTGVAAWNALTTAIKDAYNWVKNYLGLSSQGGGQPAVQGHARGGLIGGGGSGTSDSNLAWVSRGEYITPARVVRQPGVLAFLEALRGGGTARLRGGIPAFADGGIVGGGGVLEAVSVMASVREIIDAVAQSLARLTFTMVDGMRGVMRNIDSLMQTFSETIDQAIHQDLRKASDTLFEFEQNFNKDRVTGHSAFARGGLLGGHGTGTSDSNLAWVSRGEHIMPANAVRQPGVLAFLEMLRRSGGNLSRALNGLGRYAAGGLVMPSLAGASVGGMNNVTIQFPGLPPITGLRASSQVVEELRRSAAMAQVRSGGRKPSRYT